MGKKNGAKENSTGRCKVAQETTAASSFLKGLRRKPSWYVIAFFCRWCTLVDSCALPQRCDALRCLRWRCRRFSIGHRGGFRDESRDEAIFPVSISGRSFSYPTVSIIRTAFDRGAIQRCPTRGGACESLLRHPAREFKDNKNLFKAKIIFPQIITPLQNFLYREWHISLASCLWFRQFSIISHLENRIFIHTVIVIYIIKKSTRFW